MEPNTKLRILKSIGNVYDEAKGSKLEAALFEKVEPDLKELSEYFNVPKMQAFFIAIVFTMNYKSDSVDIKGMIEFFECNPIKVLEFAGDIEALYSKGYFVKFKSDHHVKMTMTNDQFSINKKITEALLKDLPMPALEKEKPANVVDVLEEIYKLGFLVDKGEIISFELFEQVEKIIFANLNFSLLKRVYNMKMEIYNTYIFLYLIWKATNGKENVDLGVAVKGVFDTHSDRFNYIQKMLSKENQLIEMNLVEIEEARFFDDTSIKLSEVSLEILKDEGIKLYATKKKKNNIIEPLQINSKELFFNLEELKQLDMLKQLLDDRRLKEIQLRLHSKSLPKGITALLHGLPGTGKTESVYQIAKETNREIVSVDISQSKSMWFGESEKIIKRIFIDYKDYAKQCETTPILLFNEADAIISKRKDASSSNVAQVENTIQNIILEELENFEGIFFATTNMVDNMDAAFERRFLFKIELKKPDISVKAKIWQSKLQKLLPSESEMLAGSFDFSGGQIDNIVRKSEMHEIINGIAVNIQDIVEFCKTEKLDNNNRSKIGFVNI